MTDNRPIIVEELNLTVSNRSLEGTLEEEYWHAEKVDITGALQMEKAGCPAELVLKALLRAMEQAENCVISGALFAERA